jgi:hypothetical protein
MTLLLIGPCMFAAPLVVLLVPLALILWPPTLILLGVAYLVVWPFAAASADGSGVRRAHTWLGNSFLTVLTPWTYFDPPKEAQAAEPAESSSGQNR